MAFLSVFGVDWRILVFQLINFAIIYFVLAKWVWPIILKAIKKRQQEIDQGLEDAQKAKLHLSTAEQEKKKVIDEAKQSAQSLINSARQQNQVTHAAFLEEMTAERSDLIAAANSQAEREKKQVLQSAQQEISQALTQSLTDFFDQDLTDKQKTVLNNKFIHALENTSAS